MATPKARPLARVVADLLTLDAADFDPAGTPEYYTKLEPLVHEVVALCPPPEAADILLGAAEKMDGWDLGPPGPLAPAVENLTGYEPHLMASVKRHPTAYTVWMANRLLNALADTARGPWLELLMGVAKHPRASAVTRDAAARFLQHQFGER